MFDVDKTTVVYLKRKKKKKEKRGEKRKKLGMTILGLLSSGNFVHKILRNSKHS